MLRQLAASFASLHLIDFVDISLAAFLLYFAMRGFRKTVHRRLLLLVAALGIVYAIAEMQQMRLVSQAFRAGSLLFLFGFIVVFQEDIRRFIETLISAPIFRLKKTFTGEGETRAILVDALKTLAKEQVGALIVLEGNVPLISAVRGGVKIDAFPSVPLLRSIFDTSSPGHDGAIILRKQRILAFGVHLPLSRHLEQVARGGTRHTAAVGLTEISDALVLCVSEETGDTSYAFNGKLVKTDVETISYEIQKHFDRISSPVNDDSTAAERIRRNWGVKVASLGVALLLRLSLQMGNDTIQKTMDFHVALRNLPTDWTAEAAQPESVRVTLKGSETALGSIPANHSVYLDIKDPKPGKQRFTLSEENFGAPDGVTVTKFEPSNLDVTMYRLKTVQVPIAIDMGKSKGRQPANVQLRTSPESVSIRIRDTMDQGPPIVTTHPVDFQALLTKGTLESKIVLPKNAQFGTNQPSVVKIYLNKIQEVPSEAVIQ